MEPTGRLSARPPTLGFALTLALGATLAACAGGSIRVVDKSPAHGELALLGKRDEARNLARSYMEKHCPQGYQVLDDGKTYVGTPRREMGASEGTVGAKSANPDHQDIGASEGRTGVKGTDPDKVQWRVRYQCDGENRGVSPPQYKGRPLASAGARPEGRAQVPPSERSRMMKLTDSFIFLG